MSTIIQSSKDSGAVHATDKADVSVFLYDSQAPGVEPIGIAKTFSFNVSKPKTPIQVLSQIQAIGYAREPEDKTFQMSELSCFERIEHLAYFTGSSTAFTIDLVHASATDLDGVPLAGSKIKVIRLEGVEFETQDYNIDATTAEFIWNFSGRFRAGVISGDIDAPVNPYTKAEIAQTALRF